MKNFKKIKLYSDKKFLTQAEYEPILFPFWGICPNINHSLLDANFEKYIQNGHKYFELTSIENCDFILWPEKYQKNNTNKNQALIQLSQQYNKPNIIFFTDDSAEKIDINNSYIFRTSLYGKTQSKNEFAMPAWSEDITEKYLHNQLPIKAKRDQPTVSYCGYTKTWKDKIKSSLGINYGSWRKIRYIAVHNLNQNKNIDTNFIIRQDFWGGVYKIKTGQNQEYFQKLRKKIKQEYIKNLIAGDYALVARGQGNYSIRFYEALSLGKIPLFIDTDCVLPYNKDIHWKKLGIWVQENELTEIDKKLINFHNHINQYDFLKLQKNIRQIWQDWISPDGFFKNFYRNF